MGNPEFILAIIAWLFAGDEAGGARVACQTPAGVAAGGAGTRNHQLRTRTLACARKTPRLSGRLSPGDG